MIPRLQAKLAPRGPAEARYYSPDRDLAHVGTQYISAACRALDEQFREPWFQEFMQHYGLVEADLHQAADLLGQACTRIIGDENPVIALEAVGFTQLPPPLQMAFYCKMGQVMLAGIWSGAKDNAKRGAELPADIQELAATAEYVAEHLRCQTSGESPTNDSTEISSG